MIVSELIALLQQQPQDMPVVVTVGIGDYPRWPDPERRHVLMKDGDPQWIDEPALDGVVEVIWL